jgi:hypothetical protein
VLLATTMPTRTIIWGKWCGAYRRVPVLALLPAIVAGFQATHSGRWTGVTLILFMVMAYGATVTSLGVALATWVSHMGRAVALTVGTYVLVTVGWLFLMVALEQRGPYSQGPAMASPFFGPGNVTFLTSEPPGPRGRADEEFYFWGPFWCAVAMSVAVALLVATHMTFNRCLGRVDGRTPSVRGQGRGMQIVAERAAVADPVI